MKLAIVSSALVLVLSSCASINQESSSRNSIASAVKKDDRGHAPRPMTQKRFESILEKYNSDDNKSLTWSEYNDWRQGQFNTVDVDKNTIIDTEEYIYEFEARLDTRLEKQRRSSLKQTDVRFTSLDKDANQAISWLEFEKSGDKMFAHWDSNDDGQINVRDEAVKNAKKSKGSFAFSMPSSHSKKGMFKLFDADENEVITSDEFLNERRSVFHLSDEDKDGGLSLAEYKGEFEDRLDSVLNKSRHASIKQTYVRFDVLDDNQDKEMTFQEFQISGKRIFDRWDKNQDGVVSSADVKKSS